VRRSPPIPEIRSFTKLREVPRLRKWLLLAIWSRNEEKFWSFNEEQWWRRRKKRKLRGR